MSSFSKNLLPRRIHKERSQLLGRVDKHGLLEKKKDYKLRAKDQNRKAARLQLLKEKASFRNPDEFYHSMINSSTKDGVIQRTVDTKSRPDAIAISNRPREDRLLAESQDSKYIAYKLSVERGKINSLRQSLHFLNDAKSTPRTHIMFADDDDEADEIVQRRKARNDQLEEQEKLSSKVGSKKRNAAYKLLKKREEREKKLLTVYSDMSAGKNLLSKGRRFLVKPSDKETGAPPVFRWLQERSR